MCANCALCNVPAHKSWCSVQCMNKRPTAHALKGRTDFLCSAVHALKKRSWSVQFMLRRLTAHAQKRSWCSLQCTVHICTTQYTILLFVPTDYCTQCACAEKKLVLTTVYCDYRSLFLQITVQYTVRMRRNEVGAHYSTVYYSSNYLQYCSLFLQITIHSAHAQKRSWCSFQCTVY